jgi:hypothetical protein
MQDVGTQAEQAPQPREQSARSRWAALVVLCVGMLMIVLNDPIHDPQAEAQAQGRPEPVLEPAVC